MNKIATFIATLLLLAATSVLAQEQPVPRSVVGFYNVENLCDTLRSDFYDDGDYTPSGRLRWGKERYERKLKRLSEVIDLMQCDIVALAEVESKEAVEDLVCSLEEDYCYIHRTTSDYRGMDMALLYKADRFWPTASRQIDVGSSREVLHISGELWNEPVELLIWHAPSRLQQQRYRHDSMERFVAVADSLADKGKSVVIMGDLNCSPEEDIFARLFSEDKFYLPLLQGDSNNKSYYHDGRWELIDHIILSRSFAQLWEKIEGQVVAAEWMLSNHKNSPQPSPQGIPLRTFDGNRYLGGASDHLPIRVVWGE